MATASQTLSIAELAEKSGIALSYLDHRDNLRTIPESTQRYLLECLNAPLPEGDPDARYTTDFDRLTQHTYIVTRGQPVALSLNTDRHISLGDCSVTINNQHDNPVDYQRLELKDDLARQQLLVHADLDPGEFQLNLKVADKSTTTTIICAPRQTYSPTSIHKNARAFGINVQVYTLTSDANWGIGDYSDLRALAETLAPHGVDALGLSPLHALFPANPLHVSPYSPSSRAFLNTLLIDVPAIAALIDSELLQTRLATPTFQQQLAHVKATALVDYQGVADLKYGALEELFDVFKAEHVRRDTPLAESFDQFVQSQGEALVTHATYDALHEHFLSQSRELWGWPVWPLAFRDPRSATVEKFHGNHRHRVTYFMFLQWCAFEQLAEAQQAALAAGMRIGLYLDMAIGADLGGSEIWANQHLYRMGISVGSPPDEMALNGQDWGFPALDPGALNGDVFALLRQNFHANMSMAGAVRFDHCIALHQLWWIPRGQPPSEGGHVRYPSHEITGVLALESQIHRCMVIGEDLGTVPPELPDIMRRYHIHSYLVLLLEQSDSALVTPKNYPAKATAAITTHDLPTLVGWWSGHDITMRHELGLLGEQNIDTLRSHRQEKKKMLLAALEREQLLVGAEASEHQELNWRLNAAIHIYLAMSSSELMVAQLDDLQMMVDPVNVPGTYKEYPNWQRKMKKPIDGFFDRPDMQALLRDIAAARNTMPGSPVKLRKEQSALPGEK